MIPAESPRDFVPLFRVERVRLLDLLHSLESADWDRPSPCPGWSVLGLAAHLLGDDIVYVASLRDGHRGTPAPQGLSEQQFIEWLDSIQVEWVHAARRFSPRQVVELLEWTDEQVADVIAARDPAALTTNVSWASTSAVPAWLDQARHT